MGDVASMESPFLLDDLPLDKAIRPTLDHLASRIANVVQSLPPTSPVLVSGDWGSGKTTLLRSVCRKLTEADLSGRGTPPIMFEAWQYESSSALLPALMRRIWNATPESFRGLKMAKALLWELVRWASSVAARMAAPVLGGALGMPAGFESELDVAKAAKQAAKAMSEAKPVADPIDELRDAFAKLVERAWPGRFPVVFIDDLDRCNPAEAVVLLDAIRSLAVQAERLRVRFVVALDRGVVAQAISAKFANVRGYDGNRYLEKIFPIEFHVPSPGPDEVQAMIQEMATPLEEGERKQVVWALTQALGPPAFANPRLIKRCFNRHRLLRYFEHGSAKSTDDDKLCLQWIAATERWPRLRTLQQRRRPDFWSTVAPGEIAGDAELRVLFAEPGFGHWLDACGWRDSNSLLERFDAADARLRCYGL